MDANTDFAAKNKDSKVFAAALLLAVAAASVGIPSDAFADGFFVSGLGRINTVSTYATQAVYSIGTIGLVVLGVFAFFGRFKWAHFFSLAGGMFLVTMATQLFAFLQTGT